MLKLPLQYQREQEHMSDPTVLHDTFTLERTYAHPAERVLAAFSDPALRRQWYAEGLNHTVEQCRFDFRVGGAERVEYRFGEHTPFPGALLVSEGLIHDIVPGRRFVFSGSMTLAGHRFSASLVTLELVASGTGTTLYCTHQGAFFEHADGPEIRRAGWNSLLDRLGAVVAA
jgi:uncharacterized protein YndB with AHSA1/START domain